MVRESDSIFRVLIRCLRSLLCFEENVRRVQKRYQIFLLTENIILIRSRSTEYRIKNQIGSTYTKKVKFKQEMMKKTTKLINFLMYRDFPTH